MHAVDIEALPQYAWVNPAPVPKPGSLLLMAAGLAGLAGRRRFMAFTQR